MFGVFTDHLKAVFAMKSGVGEQTIAMKENDKIGSNQNIKVPVDADLYINANTAAKELENTTWSIWNALDKTKMMTSNRIEDIAQSLGSTLGIIAFCVKPGDKNEVVKSGKIAVIIESDGTQSTEEVVWAETEKKPHHKGSHSSSLAVKDSKITQPATKKNVSTHK